MERESSSRNEVFRSVPKAVSIWGFELMSSQQVARETESGVFGFGISTNDMEATTVFVGLNTDLSDKTIFPDEVSGERIVYERMPLPEVQ